MLWSWVLGYKDSLRCPPCLAKATDLDPAAMQASATEYILARECFRAGWAMAERNHVHEDTQWDAGDLGCGDLVLELRVRLEAMKPGQVIRVRATDPGAPEDMPAWCRMTGHALVQVVKPEYWIRKKG